MLAQLHVIGLTGGIATGKSTCARILSDMLPNMVLFDADACVKLLYQRDDVLSALQEYFGQHLIQKNGSINKSLLRERVFSNLVDKEFVEKLFHPLVRKECLALLEETAHRAVSPLFVADVPLLFEGGFDFGQSANLLVATSRKTQIERILQRNKWDMNMVQSALSSQIPIGYKHAMADIVFWNEGPLRILHAQCRRFIQSLSISC